MSTAKKIDPFKTAKTRKTTGSKMETVKPPEAIAQAIDSFRKATEQAKHFQGEATVYKEAITEFSQKEYAKRAQNGKTTNFKLSGTESMATYIVQDSSSSLSEEEVEAIAEEFGEEAAEDLTCKDYASLRFDPEVLEANFDAVLTALRTLPDEVLENLFKPMALKAVPGAVTEAAKYTKDAEDFLKLMTLLKIKNYVR